MLQGVDPDIEMDQLKQQFKLRGRSTSEQRRRRLEENVELRKTNKEDYLAKLRQIDNEFTISPEDQEEPTAILDNSERQNRLEKITSIKSMLERNDPSQRLTALQLAHKFLATFRPRPIDLFVEHGLIPTLIQALKSNDDLEVKYEAAWVLTTIAFGSHDETNAIVQAGAVDVLIDTFETPVPRIVNQAVWCIGNIIGDGPELQQHLISKGIIPKLISLIADKTKRLPSDFRSNVIWALANTCENSSHPNGDLESCLNVLARHIYDSDNKVIRESLRGISMLSDSKEWLDEIYDANVLPEIASYLKSSDGRIVKSSLKIIGHFAAGNDRQAQYVLDCVALPAILDLMCFSTNPEIAKDATRAAGNIACGSDEQILTLLNAGIAKSAVHVIENGDKSGQVEALHLLTNITTLAKFEQLTYLDKNGVTAAVCRHLNRRSNSAIYNSLKCLHNILRIADKYEKIVDYTEKIEEAKGKEYIEQLTTHENISISSKASHIFDKYFNGDNNLDGFDDSQSEIGAGDTISEMSIQGFESPGFDF